jgi:uncharacterized protein (DUF1778 family)
MRRATPTEAVRAEKLSLRFTEETERKLRAVAAAFHRSVSEFVLESGLPRAREILAGRQKFDLRSVRWKAFHGRALRMGSGGKYRCPTDQAATG